MPLPIGDPLDFEAFPWALFWNVCLRYKNVYALFLLRLSYIANNRNQWLNYFLIAAVTNCQYGSGLRKYKFHLSYNCGLQKSKIGQEEGFLLKALGENLFPSFFFFQLLEDVCIPWLMAPAFIFKACNVASWNLSLTLILFSCLLLWFYFAGLNNPQ